MLNVINAISALPIFTFLHFIIFKLLFKFCTEHIQQLVDSLFLEVGLFNQHLTWCIEHSLSSIQSDGLDGINNPLVDLVRELIQIDILIGLTFIQYTEYVDSILGKHRSQLDVHTATTDSQRNLLRLQINLGLMVLGIDIDA